MMHDPKSLAEEIAWRTCCPDQKACPAPTRSMCSRWSYVAPAADFLTALLAARPDVAAVLNGEAVAVPPVATPEMISALGYSEPKTNEVRGIFWIMCGASPYAQEPEA